MRLSALLGLGLLAFAWLGPLPRMAEGSATVHMGLHLAIVALVPALLAPSLPVRPGALIAGAAVGLEMLAVWGWHAPAAHVWARTSDLGFALEQASFLGAGLFLWAAARAAGDLGGTAILLVTTMHMTLLGALIGLSPNLLYPECGYPTIGLGPLEDQQVAGAMMALAGGGLYLAFALARLRPAPALPRRAG